MRLPLQVSFKNCDHSDSVVTAIQENARRLDRFFPRIMGCRVIVESPNHRHAKGNLYRVLVDMTLPGKEIVARRSPDLNSTHSNVYLAVRDSFKAAQQQLKQQAQLFRGKKKQKRASPSARRAELEEGELDVE